MPLSLHPLLSHSPYMLIGDYFWSVLSLHLGFGSRNVRPVLLSTSIQHPPHQSPSSYLSNSSVYFYSFAFISSFIRATLFLTVSYLVLSWMERWQQSLRYKSPTLRLSLRKWSLVRCLVCYIFYVVLNWSNHSNNLWNYKTPYRLVYA